VDLAKQPVHIGDLVGRVEGQGEINRLVKPY
jgi:hypothetical protein